MILGLALVFAAVAGVAFDERTGAIGAFGFPDGRTVATDIVGSYRMMSRSGDAEASEREDAVVGKSSEGGAVTFTCTNPKLPGIQIVKRYRAENGGLRRTLSFRNLSSVSRYVTPFVECHFASDYQDGLWFLGAGYIGPYCPFPKVPWAYEVNNYVQSSKGLVFVHPNSRRGDFAHYRVKIDETVVLPWWHSTIGHYREYHDRLTYLPDGYRMALGTFGLYPNRTVSVTDQYTAYDGGLFGFFDGVFARDGDVAREFASIPPPPDWARDVIAVTGADNDDFYVRWLTEMLEDGEFIDAIDGPEDWGDYSAKSVFHGFGGGVMTRDEVADVVRHYRSASKRIHPFLYNIVISAGSRTPIIADRPLWHRIHDRDGNPDSLFPGFSVNWQTMFNYPDCRDWLVENAFSFAREAGVDVTYLDESQMTNTIDWEHDAVTRDDDTVKFWKQYVARKHREGILWFANGSGNPYADINFMESGDELRPARWREWAGIGFGIAMINRMRPGQRTALLYWNVGADYVNRVLSLGWIPRPILNPDCLSVLRAVHQSGNLWPVNAVYSPDWRRDEAVEVESHAMRRDDTKDVLLSFVNRASEPADIPVRVDLSTLGFGSGERINAWRLHVDVARAGTNDLERLSDAKIKANWRNRGIVARARLSDPELVCSGPAEGAFETVIGKLGTDRIEQFLFTSAPLSLFAVDGMPLSAFYTRQRHARIVGRTVTCDREADVLLMDRGRTFADLTVNGSPAAFRRIRIGGDVGCLVRLDAGEWTLGWRVAAEGEAPDEDVTLPAPGDPGTTKVTPASSRMGDAEHSLRQTNVRHGGVTVTAAATVHTQFEDGKYVQPDLPVAQLEADEYGLVLQAGTSRRSVQTRWMASFAGLELNGARSVRCRFSHTFGDAVSAYPGHVAPYVPGAAFEFFTGLLVDYSVGGQYVRRVSIATGLFHPQYSVAHPMWGTMQAPNECLTLGDWIDGPAERLFTLDLERFAPEGWDGRAFLSVGASHVMPGRSLKLEILDFNGASAADAVVPARANQIKDGMSDWTDPNSYENGNWVPGEGDWVIVPADAHVTLSDGNPESLARFKKFGRVVLASETSRIDFDIGGQEEVTLSMPITSSGYAVGVRTSVYGPIVKKGAGTLRLNSTSQVIDGTNVDYLAAIEVAEGVLKLQDDLTHPERLGRITVRKGSTLCLPEERGEPCAVHVALRGDGCVRHDSPVRYTLAFDGDRDTFGTCNFAGSVVGDSCSEFHVCGTAQGLSGLSSASCRTTMDAASILRISSFGMRESDGPLGHVGYSDGIWSRGARLVYTGLGELACSRYFVLECGNTVLDAGTNGNLTAETWVTRGGDETCAFVLAGDGPMTNRFTQSIDDRPDGSNGIYLKKEGVGTWLLSDTDRSFAGGISVDEGVLQFPTYADRGQPCSMGTAACPTDGTLGPGGFSDEHRVDYAVRLGGPTVTGVRRPSGRLEYVGPSVLLFTNRLIGVDGVGGLRANGTKRHLYAHVRGISSGTMELHLDGDSTAENEVNDVSDGTAGGVLSVVKGGTGTWYLSGNQSFGGDLAVNGGMLVVRNPVLYRWYNWTVTSTGPSHGSDTFYLSEFCLCDKDGNMVTKGLRSSADRLAVGPGEAARFSTRPFADGNDAVATLFDDILYENYYWGTLAAADGTDRPREDDPSTWLQFVMRLRPDDPAVVSYDYANYVGTIAGGQAEQHGVRGYALYGSLDGLEWELLKRCTDRPFAYLYAQWSFAGGESHGSGVHAGGDSLPRSGPTVLPNVLGNVSAVSVSNGGRLVLESGSAPVTISRLRLDAGSGGVIEGFDFARRGEVEIRGLPRTNADVTLPVTFLRVRGLANLAHWTLTDVDSPEMSRKLVVNGDRIEVCQRGMTVIVR